MKKRYLYALLWAVPGLFIAGTATMILFGMLLGVLWLFVFGDNAWPSATQPVLAILAIVTFLAVWVGLTWLGYRMGARLENEHSMNRKHVLFSAGVTLLFILYILFQQWSVGNLGPRSDSLICSDFCVQRGYSGSGMPPGDSGERICSCYDESGDEAITVPLESIDDVK